ncbi:drug:h+ antiporter [Schizopora paradoxa]|uniref:Drug:h+ antiporter n=1 Tax=Schizopora paradoxa TaxID=27342 RepID=A0A0H2RKH4_9AGAM|nr:drug:h+ antiporter [Schizopora paradoxa]
MTRGVYSLLNRDSTDSESHISSDGTHTLDGEEGQTRRHSKRRTVEDESILEAEQEVDAHIGVKKVEAAGKVYGRYSRWVLYISLGLASYIYSLDSSTTYAYLAFAASAFGQHSLIASIQVAQSIILAVGKPVIAKIADVASRGTAYIIVLFCYVIGYTVIASSQNVQTLGGGIIVYAIGYTGLQLLTQIIIADITTLKWRGLVSSLASMPFVLNGFIGPNISNAVLEHLGWRWGYAMFAVLVPATVLPLIITLVWAERRSKQLGIVQQALAEADVPISTPPGEPLRSRIKRVVDQLDLVGLALLGAAVSLILLPLTLSKSAGSTWRKGAILSMLFVGISTLIAFGIWDFRYASRPVIAPRFLRNRSIVFASLIGFFDFASYFLTFTYLYTFVLVVKPWTLLEATYFAQVQTVALTVFAFVGGLLMWRYRRYKSILVGGLLIRLLGVALMIHSRGANASTAELIWTQILQGLGGGFASSASQVGAQASVPHIDVAMVTASTLLFTEIGGAVGSAMAGAIWANTMPSNLAKYLPSLSDIERSRLFGNISSVLDIPRGDPIREGVIEAYDDTMKVMVIAATLLSVPPVLFSLLMPNWYLGDQQNAVDTSLLEDEGDEDTSEDEDREEEER